MKKLLLILGTFVLIMALGTLSFADTLKGPILTLSDLTGEEVSTLREALDKETNMRDLAEVYGVLETFEAAMEMNLEAAINALIASGDLTEAESDEILEFFKERDEIREQHRNYQSYKRSFLKVEENREDFIGALESLVNLTGESVEVIKEALKESKPIEVALDYGVLEAFEAERKAENIKLIDVLFDEGIITEGEVEEFKAMVSNYDYTSNQNLKENIILVKDWLKENVERPERPYKDLIKSPVEIYAELTGESIDAVEEALEESTLRVLVMENNLQEAFIETRIENIEEVISQLETDGMIPSELSQKWLSDLSDGSIRNMRKVIEEIKDNFKN
jgi:uncharacterized protein YvpB